MVWSYMYFKNDERANERVNSVIVATVGKKFVKNKSRI